MAHQPVPLEREQVPAAPPAETSPRPEAGGRSGVHAVLSVYVRTRLFTLLVAVVAGWRVGAGPLSVLNRWDAGWFVRAAREGYPHHIPIVNGQPVETTIPFFPFYPLLLRVVSFLTPLSEVLAGVVVSLVAGAIAALLVYRIAVKVTDDPARGLRAVTLFAFFPGSFVMSMPYSEAVMVALAAACILALLEERWWTAGMCAALATASRSSALALVPAALWQAVSVIRRDRASHGGPFTPAGLKPLVAPLVAPLGTVGYFAFLWMRTGDPVAYLHAQQAWFNHVSLGRPIITLVSSFVRAPFTAVQPAMASLSLLFVLVVVPILLRRRWPSLLSVYSVSIVAINLISRSDGVRPRDLLTAFPLFIAAADVVDERWLGRLVPISALLLAGLLTFHNLGAWGPP